MQKRIEHDLLSVNELFQALEVKSQVSKVVRLRSRDAEKTMPMKIVMASEEGKSELIAAAKAKLGKACKVPRYANVAVKPDRTPKERAQLKILVDEIKERERKGEQGLMIRNGRVVQKKPPGAEGLGT